MFGLLYLFKKRGDLVKIVIATDGSLGSSETISNLSEIRLKETQKGLKEISSPIMLNIKDGHLGDDITHKKLLKKEIFKHNPDLIVTHSESDYHPDHRALSKIVQSIAGIYIPILFCDNFMGINYIPNYIVDITEAFSKKINAINAHISQNPKSYIDAVTIWNRFRSAQCNAPKSNYAEAYNFKSSFPFYDIRDILPPSPMIRATSLRKKGGLI